MVQIDPILAGIPVAGGIGALTWLGWNRTMHQRKNKALDAEKKLREQALAGSVSMRDAQQTWRRSQGHGQIPIAAIGSYAANQTALTLTQFLAAGAEDHVGPILLGELDDAQREATMRDIPLVFHDRVVPIRSEHYSVGFSNAPIPSVLQQENLWGRDVRSATGDWLAQMQRSYRPGVLLVFVSPGGMAGIGRAPLEQFRDRYPDKPIYVATILDDKTPVRDRFPDLRAYYSYGGLVRGFLLCDNRRSSRRNDVGLAFLLAGLVGATWIGEHPLNLWNAVGLIFPEEHPGRMAAISTWAEQLPVYYLPKWEDVLPEIYYTRGELVVEKSMRGIRAVVDRPELQSVALDAADKGNTRVCLTCTPVTPPHFSSLAGEVDDRLESWRRSTDVDLSLQYSSFAAPLSPSTRETPMLVVLLQPLKGEPELIDRYALGQDLTDDKFWPKPGAIEAINARRQALPTNGARQQ